MVRKYHACIDSICLKYLLFLHLRPISHRPLLLEDIYDPVNTSLGCETCFGQRNMSEVTSTILEQKELLPCSAITLTLDKG